MGDVTGALLAVCGVDREARIVAPYASAGCLTSGGRVERLRAELARIAAQGGCRGVISIGLAGGLDPALRAGDLITAEAVIDTAGATRTERDWTRRLAELTGARGVALALGADTLAADPADKARRFAASGASVIDMESHVAARWASAAGLPFTVLRVVSDDAHRALPSAASAGMGANGRVDVGAVIAGLALNPWQLPALLRTARDVEAGLRRLAAAVAAAGAELALPR